MLNGSAISKYLNSKFIYTFMAQNYLEFTREEIVSNFEKLECNYLQWKKFTFNHILKYSLISISCLIGVTLVALNLSLTLPAAAYIALIALSLGLVKGIYHLKNEVCDFIQVSKELASRKQRCSDAIKKSNHICWKLNRRKNKIESDINVLKALDTYENKDFKTFLVSSALLKPSASDLENARAKLTTVVHSNKVDERSNSLKS